MLSRSKWTFSMKPISRRMKGEGFLGRRRAFQMLGTPLQCHRPHMRARRAISLERIVLRTEGTAPGIGLRAFGPGLPRFGNIKDMRKANMD